MFGSEDLSAALAALAMLEESNLFLMTAATQDWHGSAAQAAQTARSQHIGLTSAVIDDLQQLVALIRSRDDLRATLCGGL